MPFAQNFRFCMEQRGYSAYRLAKILGVSNQGVLNWLDGGNVPHKKTRQKIAEHFGITLAELDGDELPTLPPEGAKKALTKTGERENNNPVTQEIFEFVRSASVEELAEVVRYIQFLKTKRVAK